MREDENAGLMAFVGMEGIYEPVRNLVSFDKLNIFLFKNHVIKKLNYIKYLELSVGIHTIDYILI